MYILKKSLETTGHGTNSTATSTTGHNTPTTGTSGRNTPSTATSGSNTSSITTTASASTLSHGGANRRKGKPCVVLTSLTMNQSVDIIILRIHLQLAK